MALVLSSLGGTTEAIELPDGDGDIAVKLKVSLTGTRNGEDWPPRGGTCILPADEARHMILAGMVEIAPEAPVVETAAVAPPETASVKRPRAKKVDVDAES